VVAHARARVRKIRFFDQPYNPRKREQSCASGGKAVNLAKANTLRFITACSFSALLRIRGQWTDAGQSAHSLSVDWQAWGTKGGLCWRATRDGLRHVPAGPPKSTSGETPQHSLLETHANCGYPRIETRSPSSTCLRAFRRKQRGKPHLQIEIHFSGVPHLPGPEKTRCSPRAASSREGFLGLPLGLVLGLGFAQLIPTH
jgi:hypothetical protein